MKKILTFLLSMLMLTGVAFAQKDASKTPGAKGAASGDTSPMAAKTGTKPARETNCKDRIDNDGDSLADCFDADCYEDPACKSAGGMENTDLLCSDGVDNDQDGFTDCEDHDCVGPTLSVCKGSWKGPLHGTGASNTSPKTAPLPQLGKGMTVEDLVGKGNDKDGERNDQVCSDGIDNDGDGAIDCQDYGCRFDPAVVVCNPTAGSFRFSMVAAARQSYDFEKNEDSRWDTKFSRIQLRILGKIPGIQDSFYLLSARAENTLRLTFAMFEVPIYKNHRLNLNSGGGGLSNNLVMSVHKNPLLEPAYYLNTAFESGNGAAIELNGPVIQGLLDYRVFVAGGAGKFNGNVGGRYFKFDQYNYTWAAGGQLAFFPIGRFDRWDTRFLYTPVPLSVTTYLGLRYDQRALERYPAVNISLMARWGRLLAVAEAYGKRELEFKSWQLAYNVMLVALLIPKWLVLAGDFGQYYATDFDLPANLLDEDELDRQTDEMMGRVALHLYFYRDVGLLSAMFRHRFVENYDRKGIDRKETEAIMEVQYRF